MAEQRADAGDVRFEQLLGKLLISGVAVAASVVLAGGIVYLFRHGEQGQSYQVFQGEPAELRNFRDTVILAFHGMGRGLIQLGIMLLIATPVARVTLSLFSFLFRRDYMYTIFTLIVLSVLLYSLLGKAP